MTDTDEEVAARVVEAKRAVERAQELCDQRLIAYYRVLRSAYREVGASELARALGVSRQRIYQVLDQAANRLEP